MKVGVTGASGFIGRRLVKALNDSEHEVYKFVRREPKDDNEIYWKPSKQDIDQEKFETLIKNDIHVLSSVKCDGKTGVEMEALTAVSVSCLTIYDMLKGLDKNAFIANIQLLEKSGGKSGDWKRK